MEKFAQLIIAIMMLSLGSAATIQVPIYHVAPKGHGTFLGKIVFQDTQYGLLIKPKLHGLTQGLHGFHIHQVADCSDNGLSARGHLDPENTGSHLGPYSAKGHLGDLPVLYVDKKGIADTETVAPRLKVANLIGHSVIIHAGGDNYADSPKSLGGGGERVACGVMASPTAKG